MIAALRTAVASVSSELAEKNAVARVLAQHGHRRLPAVVSQRDASGVTRVYLWDDAGIALVTGPSLQGTVYEVHAVPADADPTSFDLFIPAARGRSAFAAGRKAKALANPAPARAPLAQAPRRIVAAPAPQLPTRQPAVLARHNAPDDYEVNPGLPGGKQTLGEPVPFADVAVGSIVFRIVGVNEVGIEQVTSKSMAGPYASMKIKNLAKTMKIDGGRALIASTAAPTQGMHAAEDLTATTFYGSKTKPTLALSLAHKYLPMLGINPDAQPLLMAYGKDDFRTLPMPSASVPGPSAGAKAPKATGEVAILFEPGVGLFVSGKTFDAKEAIKNEGFFWTGKEGKYGYPKSVWAAANSDQATSESSLVGWQGEKKTVTATIDALKAALAAKGLSVSVETPTGGMTSSPAASADPKPPPVSPLPVDGIPVSFSSGRFKALAPNPVWAEGGGVSAIAARLKQTGSKPGGGLAGGVYTDSLTGLKYLAKFPPNEQMVGSEVLAAHLYRALGVVAPDMRPAVVDGKPTILSPWIDGMKKFATSVSSWNANVPAIEKKWLASSFPSDVWLADYDVVGLEWDNLLSLPDGHPIRIDPGASLMFRAGGQLKSPLPTVDAGIELETMLFQPKGDKIQHVFAEAKDDPALMVPLATAIETYMQKGYLDAVAKWAGYTSKVGLPTGYSIGDYLFIRGQGLSMAVAEKAKAVAPAPAPAYVTFTAGGLVESIAKKIAALLPGTTASGTSVGPWTVAAFPGNGIMLESKGGVLTALILAGGDETQKLEYTIPSSGSLVSFAVSRAADIANAFKPYSTKATPKPAPSAAPMGTGAGLTEVSLTEIDALPEGSVVTAAASPGETFYIRDASGLWRELTEDGDFMPGLFSDDVYDTLDGEVLLAYEGSGTGPEADDPIMLSAYYTMAQQAVSMKTKGAVATLLGPKPTAPKPAPAVTAPNQLGSILTVAEVEALPPGSLAAVVSLVVGESTPFFYILQRVKKAKPGAWIGEARLDGDPPSAGSVQLASEFFDPGGANVAFAIVLLRKGTAPPSNSAIFGPLVGQGVKVAFDQTLSLAPGALTGITAENILAKTIVFFAPALAAAQGLTFTPVAVPTPAPAAAPAPYGDPNPWPTTGFATDLGPDPVWVQVGGSLVLASRLATATFGGKLGSFPGGKVTDPLTKGEFYVKFFTNAEHALTEALASHLYRILGINAPDVRWAPAHLFGSKGSGGYKVGLISPWKGGYIQRTNGSFDPAERQFLCREFPADVWMANYDVVGKGPATKYDNLLVTDDFGDQNPKHYLRIDQGAALDYRSTGSTKKSAQDWGMNAAQTWGDFLSSQHPTIYKVFKDATPTTGAVMIQRIGALVGTPAFDATLDFAGRKADLGSALKGRAGFLAGMLVAETTASVAALPPAGPMELFVGMKAMATTLKPMIKSEKWSVLKKDDGTLYVAGFGAGLAMEIGPQGFASKGNDAFPLPAGGYEVVAVGEQVGSTSPVTLYAKYGQPVAAPAPTPSLTSPSTQGKLIAEQVRQILASKGFDVEPVASLITLFKVRLYEGTEPAEFPVKFPMQESKVLVKLGADDVGLFSPGKAGVENAIAAALLAALRLKMANLNLTKKPLGVPAAAPMPAVPMGGPVTVGSILTTVAQVAALLKGSVIAHGSSTGTKALTSFVQCVDPDEWRFVMLSGGQKGATFLTSELLDDATEEWGVVVIRVGFAADLDPFYEHAMDVTGKSGAATTFSIPLGA